MQSQEAGKINRKKTQLIFIGIESVKYHTYRSNTRKHTNSVFNGH